MSEQAAADENKQVTPVDLVFQGGGVKGIGLVGAYSVLEERAWLPAREYGRRLRWGHSGRAHSRGTLRE